METRSPHHLISSLCWDKHQPRPLLYRQSYMLNKLVDGTCLYARTVKGHYGCINALAFSQQGQEFLISGGDDMRVLVWRVSQLLNGDYKYVSMTTTHESNIFSLATSCDNSYIYSSGNDGQIIKHDFNTGSSVRMYHHTSSVYCVDAFPTSPHLFAAATEDGSIFITDSREERLSQDMILDESVTPYHSLSINPCDEQLIVVGNETSGAFLYDLRNWKKLLQYRILSLLNLDISSVAFNSSGTRVFVMQRTHPPAVFSTLSPDLVFFCEDDNGGYRNTVTMKSGCFAGLDGREFVVSGSDDFRVYWWQLPSTTDNNTCSCESLDPEDAHPKKLYPHLVVPGHRSIVNQTRYSDMHHVLCSSGVEKTIKLWTPFPQYSGHEPLHSLAPPSREHYTTIPSEHDSDQHNSDTIEENERVLAFFDHLIDQERNIDLDSSSSLTSSDDNEEGPHYDLYYFLRNRIGDNLFHDDFSSSESATPLSDCSGNTSSLIPPSPWSSLDDNEMGQEEEEEEDKGSEKENDKIEKEQEKKEHENKEDREKEKEEEEEEEEEEENKQKKRLEKKIKQKNEEEITNTKRTKSRIDHNEDLDFLQSHFKDSSLTSNQSPLTSNQSLLTSNQPSLTPNQPLLTSSQPLLTSNQPLLTSNQSLLTSNQPSLTPNQPLLTSNQSLLTSNQPSLTPNQPLLTSSQPLLTSNQPLLTSNQTVDESSVILNQSNMISNQNKHTT